MGVKWNCKAAAQRIARTLYMWTKFRKAAAGQKGDPLEMVAACKYLSVSVIQCLMGWKCLKLCS